MNAPNAEVIARLKEQNPDRALHQVELKDPGDEETYIVIMKGPTEDEYKLLIDGTLDAREKAKNATEKNEMLAAVAEKAVLRQTVWPAREEVKDLLFKHPAFADKLADKIAEHAGSSAEVRSKKL